MNHAMVDGNKRIGAHAMLVFLALNDVELRYTQKELYEVILRIASGQDTFENLLQWVTDHNIDKAMDSLENRKSSLTSRPTLEQKIREIEQQQTEAENSHTSTHRYKSYDYER